MQENRLEQSTQEFQYMIYINSTIRNTYSESEFKDSEFNIKLISRILKTNDRTLNYSLTTRNMIQGIRKNQSNTMIAYIPDFEAIRLKTFVET